MSFTHLLAIVGSATIGFLAGYVVAHTRSKCRSCAGEPPEARAARWLHDRRELDRALASCYAHWQRLETPFGVLIVQLESETGPGQLPESARNGDAVRELIEAFRAGLREVDQLWATGEAEVTVVLPVTDLDQARAVAWRAQPIVRDVIASHAGMAFTAGLAVVRPEDNVGMLLAAARAAVRAARANGRDQMCLREGESLRLLGTWDGVRSSMPPLDIPSVPLTPVTEA